jgi:CRP-like cAMP-binding protein
VVNLRARYPKGREQQCKGKRDQVYSHVMVLCEGPVKSRKDKDTFLMVVSKGLIGTIFILHRYVIVMHALPQEVIALLEACPIFTGLRAGEIAGLLEGSSARIRNFSGNDLIAQAGEELAFLHIVISGSVKGEMTDLTGRVIKIEDITPPRPLAPAFLFGSQNRYPVHITANGPVRILSVPKEEFLKMMQKQEQVLRNFVESVSSRGQFLSSKIKFLSFNTIKGKLSHYLLEQATRCGSDRFLLPLSQSGLAELFGVARPSVGRAISEMNQMGIIRTEGKHVEILDRRKLRELLP